MQEAANIKTITVTSGATPPLIMIIMASYVPGPATIVKNLAFANAICL